MTDTATAQAADNTQAKAPAKGSEPENKAKKALSTNDAAAVFAQTLAKGIAKSDTPADEVVPKKKPAKPQAKAVAQEPKGQPVAETTEDEEEQQGEAEDIVNDDDTSEDETQDDGAEGQATGEGAADEGEDEETFHTVIVDGEPVSVSTQELINGYMRVSDYTKKTTELARQRAELTAEKEQLADLPQVKDEYQKGAARFIQNAQLVLTAFNQGFMPSKPDEALRTSNPSEYIAQKERFEEANQFVSALTHEVKSIEARAREENQRAVQAGRVELLKVQPELQKPEVRGQLHGYIKGLGYKDEEIAMQADHRLFELAFKAMKWDDMVKRAKEPAQKNPPKVMSQTKARPDGQSIAMKKKSEASDRHKREHNVKSASNVFEQKLAQVRKGR